MTALQIEGTSEVVSQALIKSRKSVDTIIKNPNMAKEYIGQVLQNIASGVAAGKQDGCLCLMTAAGRACPFAERAGCVGCGYEIYTKTMMYTLMREYARLTSAQNVGEPTDTHRYGLILEQAVMPAIAEMLASAKLFYPDADVSDLLDIMEVEFNEIDCTNRKNE